MSALFADLEALATRLEGRPPEEILAPLASRFPGQMALACSFGKEDCVLLEVIARAGLPMRAFTLDTGFLFSETRALWAELEARYGVRIEAVTPEGQPRHVGAAQPWAVDPDGCCHARKVLPLRAKLAELGAWVTGIRREQTAERASARVVEWDARFGLVKVNPLAAWSAADVEAHLRRYAVPVSPLHVRGYLSIGCQPCTTPVRPGEDPRAGRWRGREKTECGLHLTPEGLPAPRREIA